VVTVGDELLYGTTVNGNAAWLSLVLTDVGLDVVGHAVVGDGKTEIAAAVSAACQDAELVVVTGGLGPTPDDRTREAVASSLGTSLALNGDLLEGLKTRFSAMGIESLPENVPAMAMVPEGAQILANSLGAAPGIAMEAPGGTLCVLLPGIPREMRAIVQGELQPLLEERFSRRFHPVIHRTIYTTGVRESVLAEEVARLLPPDTGPVQLAYLPDLHGVRLRISARLGPGETGSERILDDIEAALAPALSGRRYDSHTGDLAEAVGRALSGAEATLAVAESCTGGLIAKRLTDQPGSSGYFLGGVVAYANEVKTALLDVPEDTLRKHGAVSREVAHVMARGAAQRLGADYGVGVTGIAGPGGGTADRPVGTVWYAVWSGKGAVSRQEAFPGGREEVRERASQAVLHLLLRVIEEGAAP
jgi:nicotinamide-nucleotide amidase